MLFRSDFKKVFREMGIADRWILSQFAFAVSGGNPVAPYFQCFAVSTTNNPMGTYARYSVQFSSTAPEGFNDYGKLGLWPDCLYMATNHFNEPAGTFAGVAFASFSRTDMEAGLPLTSSIGFLSSASNVFTMIPSNMLGTNVPAGTPNYFVSESQTVFGFEVRKFVAGPNCGAGGTLGAATNVTQTSYSTPADPIAPW